MLIINRPEGWLTEADATPEDLFINRRSWLANAGLLAAGAGLAAAMPTSPAHATTDFIRSAALKFAADPSPPDDAITDSEAATSYNNFYEFGLDKGDPARNAGALKPLPWTVIVDGLVDKPRQLDVDKLLNINLQERVYRLRCVEAWSMVIPWIGFPLADIVRLVEPKASAKYVAFQTLQDVQQMPNQRSRALDWPYREGLRLDEAMNDLTLMSVGMYGRRLPNQNGAPLRLVVPWKYGFKSIKSIVRISFTDKQPYTTWNAMQPREYGFFANVNPAVDHPRWSQARERRIGEFRKRETLPFNGYGAQVASLYSGMDLQRFY